MNKILTVILTSMLFGCAHSPIQTYVPDTNDICVGSTELPDHLKSKFKPIEDKALLNEAIGDTLKGKLCQGQVYISKEATQIPLFRAWNSTNPNSQLGKWWAFDKPSGSVATYRTNYEICYQWSPLDKLVSCTLKPGIKVVIGTGQSAQCSEYLTYPVSTTQQVFVEDASNAITDCSILDGQFSWK